MPDPNWLCKPVCASELPIWAAPRAPAMTVAAVVATACPIGWFKFELPRAAGPPICLCGSAIPSWREMKYYKFALVGGG